MPVHADWYSEDDAIIIMTFTDIWSIEEHEKADEKVYELSNSLSKRFDLIVDYSGAKPFVPTGTLMNWVMSATHREKNFPQWGLTVFVVTTVGLETFFEAGYKVSKTIQAHGRKAKTVKEAVQLIMADRNQKRAANE